MYTFNRIVFELYKFILNIFHFAFFLILIFGVVLFYKYKNKIDVLVNQTFGGGVSSGLILFVLIFVFLVFYVSVYGLIATFININENLIQLNLEREKNVVSTSPAVGNIVKVKLESLKILLFSIVGLLAVLLIYLVLPNDDVSTAVNSEKYSIDESKDEWRKFSNNSYLTNITYINVKSIEKFEESYISYMISDEKHLEQQRVIGDCVSWRKSNWYQSGWDRQMYSVYKGTDPYKELSFACGLAKKNGIIK